MASAQDDFRDFVFTNPATLWTDMNPDFFKGTVVEGQVISSWDRKTIGESTIVRSRNQSQTSRNQS